MYLKSSYPPPPNLPPKNYFQLTLDLIAQIPTPEPDHVLYINAVSGEERTKSQFLERIYDTATALGAPKEKGGLGLNKDHIVGILSHNCLDFPVLTFALLSIATPFSLYSSFATTHELRHYHGKSDATHVFVHADLLAQFLPVAKESGIPHENIFILEGKSPESSNFQSLDDLINTVRTRKIPREPIREVQSDDLAYCVFSSGTSGFPKCVMVSHGNLCFTVFQDIMVGVVYAQAKSKTNDRVIVMGFVPMFHSMGLHYFCFKPCLGFNTLVLLPKWDHDIFIDAIPKYRVTNLFIIPSVAQQLVVSPKFHKTDLSSVQSIGCAASYLPPALATKLRMHLNQSPLSEGYGMSEGTLALIGRNQVALQHAGLLDLTSTGVLMPGMEAVLLRPDGTHCLVNEPGDLYVKGPNVALGYRGDPASTKEVYLEGGWLRTGDRFRADARGVLWFEDRAKDTLKVSGLQVSPIEVEETILAEPSGIVQEVSVAGVQLPTARTSDDKAPRAWVVLTEKGKSIPETEAKKRIDDWVKERLSKYKWLRGGIKVIETIPRNVTGKTLRRVLIEEYEAEKEKQANAKL